MFDFLKYNVPTSTLLNMSKIKTKLNAHSQSVV